MSSKAICVVAELVPAWRDDDGTGWATGNPCDYWFCRGPEDRWDGLHMQAPPDLSAESLPK